MKRLQIFDMVHHTPGEAPCQSAFSAPAHLAKLGFDGQVLAVPVQAAVLWDTFEPRVFPAGSAERAWVEKKAAQLERQFLDARAAGILCLAKSDYVVLPRELVKLRLSDLSRKAAQSFAYEVKGEFTPDIHDARIQTMLRFQVDAIFARFPMLDGLVVRVGETYLHDLPHHTGGDPLSHGVESHAVMLELLRDCVCVKHGRTLFYRTWLSGIDEDAEAYERLTANVEPHPNLFFSIKHCVNDFHRTHKFSPPLGRGRHQQIVEVQCAREYEGKGAYPNYIAAGIIDGFEEDFNLMPASAVKSLRELARGGLLAGIWTWSRGGGWNGPYIANEFWCALNAEVLAMWAKDPSRQDSELIAAFAARHGLTPEDAVKLEAICRKSAAAVVRGIASVQGGVDTWWTRDEFLGGLEDPASPMAKTIARIQADGRVGEIIAEREESVHLWMEIEALAKEIRGGDDALRSFIVTSCAYGRILYEIMAAGWTAMLLDGKGDAAKSAIYRYHESWAAFRKLAETRPDCPSLYRDTYCQYIRDKGMVVRPGMGATMIRFQNEMNA